MQYGVVSSSIVYRDSVQGRCTGTPVVVYNIALNCVEGLCTGTQCKDFAVLCSIVQYCAVLCTRTLSTVSVVLFPTV